MPYKVINQTNSINRKSRLYKELKRYKEYLNAVSSRSDQLIANLKEKSKAKQVKEGTSNA